jgi:hypothetical protein
MSSSSTPILSPVLQPISTAPRDGTFILVAGESGYTSTPLRYAVCRWVEGDWRDHAHDHFTDGGPEALYWMPLPSLRYAAKPLVEDVAERAEEQGSSHSFTTKVYIQSIETSSFGSNHNGPEAVLDIVSRLGLGPSLVGKLTFPLLSSLPIHEWDGFMANQRAHPIEVTFRFPRKVTRVEPWTEKTAPLGAWLRGTPPYGSMVIASVDPEGISFVNLANGVTHVTFEALLETYEHSVDGGKTWKPAGVTAEEWV